ncbi:MAG: HutD family protein [Gammaproteobacteria bacterium]
MHELAPGIRLLQLEDYRHMLWKNGLGTTTEITVSPIEAGLNGKPFDWRVSIAEIDNDCEFSRFPGYDRSLTLIERAGMELSFDSAPSQRIDQHDVSFTFKGESQTYCRLLDGPVLNFNVMSRQEKFKHACEVLSSPGSIHWKVDTKILLIYCPYGVFNLEGLQEKQIEMNRGQTLILDKGADHPGYENFWISAMSENMVAVIVNISNA